MSGLRLLCPVLALVALAACDPAGPALVGLVPVGSAETPSATAQTTGDGAPLDAMRPDASPMASSAAMAADAVAPDPSAGTEDPADLAAAATAAVADAPGPAPVSTDASALTAYAQSTSHPVGTAVHAREFASPERAERACARYASADQAQSAFLAAGGPAQDPRGLDPDGDGYACAWDPASARGAGAG